MLPDTTTGNATLQDSSPNRMRQLGDYIASTRFDALPEAVVWRAKMIALDNIGCAMAGSILPGSPTLLKASSILGEGRGATIVLQPHGSASPFSAAVINSTYIGNTDLSEGVSRGVVHPGVVIVPACLAEGERLRSHGRDLLLALVTGYDVLVRMGWALAHVAGAPIEHGKPKSLEKGWFGPSLMGAFGAVTSTAKLNGMKGPAIAEAFGIAGNLLPTALVAGFRQGAEVKGLGCGWASGLGIYAAHLAAASFTGVTNVEETLLPLLVDAPDYDLILDRLGERYEILDVDTKFFAVGPMRSEIECGLLLYANHRYDPERIREIVVEASGRSALTGVAEPPNVLAAKFSLPYAVSQVLLGRSQPEMMLEAFTAKVFDEPAWRPLAKKFRIQVSAEFDAAFETYPQLSRPARVTLVMDDGTRISEMIKHPRGLQSPNPPTEADYKEKFRYLAGHFLPKHRVEKIIEMVLGLENLEDVGKLTGAVAV